MPVITIANQKGGVGKTTFTFNLAKGLAGREFTTLAVDNDHQGNLTGALLEDPREMTANVLDIYQEADTPLAPQSVGEGLDLIGSTIHLATVTDRGIDIVYNLDAGLEPFKDKYDFILIDCQPSFSHLTYAALIAADYVLIPTKPAPFALDGLKHMMEIIERVQRRPNQRLQVLGLVLNLVESRTTIATELEEAIRENYGQLVFDTVINKAVKVEESPHFNQSIMEYEPKSKSANQFEQLISEMSDRLKVERYGGNQAQKIYG